MTLNKSEKEFSDTTLYEDYSISKTLFHWQSQSTTSDHSKTGQRYIQQNEKGNIVFLFVRKSKKDAYGKYHVTNEGGYITWYEFAKEIFAQAGMDVNVVPVTSDKFPAKAKRPHNSRMDKSKLKKNGFTPLPTWQDALKRYLSEIR